MVCFFCLFTAQKGSTSAVPQEKHESMSDVLKITQFLQFALIQCRKEFKNINTINFHSVVEKYVSEFFKRTSERFWRQFDQIYILRLLWLQWGQQSEEKEPGNTRRPVL